MGRKICFNPYNQGLKQRERNRIFTLKYKYKAMKHIIIIVSSFLITNFCFIQKQQPNVKIANFYYKKKITSTVLSCNTCDEKDNRTYQLIIEGSGLEGYELQKEKVFFSIKRLENVADKLCYNVCFINVEAGKKMTTIRLRKNLSTIDIKLNTNITVKSDMF